MDNLVLLSMVDMWPDMSTMNMLMVDMSVVVNLTLSMSVLDTSAVDVCSICAARFETIKISGFLM